MQQTLLSWCSVTWPFPSSTMFFLSVLDGRLSLQLKWNLRIKLGQLNYVKCCFLSSGVWIAEPDFTFSKGFKHENFLQDSLYLSCGCVGNGGILFKQRQFKKTLAEFTELHSARLNTLQPALWVGRSRSTYSFCSGIHFKQRSGYARCRMSVKVSMMMMMKETFVILVILVWWYCFEHISPNIDVSGFVRCMQTTYAQHMHRMLTCWYCMIQKSLTFILYQIDQRQPANWCLIAPHSIVPTMGRVITMPKHICNDVSTFQFK